jgi:hypothetical protein
MRDTFTDAADNADPAAAGLAAITVAITRYLAGRFLDAQRWINEAVSQSERKDPLDTRLLAHALQAGVSLALEDQAAAYAAGERLANEQRGVALRGTRPGSLAAEHGRCLPAGRRRRHRTRHSRQPQS